MASSSTPPPSRARQRIQGLLERIAWFSVHHARSVVISCLALTLVAGWLASGLELRTDIESLIPEDVPAASRLQGLLERYGSSEPVVIAISGQGEDDLDERVELALAIRDGIEDAEGIHPVSGLFGEDPWSLLEGPQAGALLLYLEPVEVDALLARMNPENIDARVAANRDALRSPLGPAAVRLLAEDPLGFVSLALSHLGALKGNLRFGTRDGVLYTEDAEYVMMIIRAEGPTADFVFAQEVLDRLESVAITALEGLELEGSVGKGPRPPESTSAIHVGLTGAPAILVDYREILARDIRKISLGAFLAVLTLFLLAFRRLTALLAAGVPLVVGVIWSLGFAELAIGEISVFTAGSVAILCGLAIDFTIHLYNRYLEEVHAGRDMIRAFAAAHGETGLGILAAAFTTAWAFLAAGFSTFKGLKHLGILCAAGMFLSLAASLLLVPALSAIVARMSPAPDRPRGLASFGLGHLSRTIVRHPRSVATIGLAATLLLSLPALRVHLDEDFRRFRPTSAPAIRLQDELVSRTGTSLQPVVGLVPGGDDISETIERSARLEKALDPLVRQSEVRVAAVLGPGRVVPAASDQRKALERLRAAREAGLDPAAVERELLAALERHGFRVDSRARKAAARVRTILERDAVLSVEEAREGPLGPVLDDLIIPDGKGGYEGLVSVYPGEGARSSELLPAIYAARDASGVETDFVGARVLSQELRPLIQRDAAVAVAISSVGVLTILFVAFRRPILVLLTFVPLVVGVVVSVGLMALLGIDFNLVSLSMLPLILGIGIDNGIHVVHRFIEHDREELEEVFEHTGRGIVMTSLTTIVGFGALVFADYPGLISSGVLAILGVGATLVTAVTLVPSFLTLLHIRRSARN